MATGVLPPADAVIIAAKADAAAASVRAQADDLASWAPAEIVQTLRSAAGSLSAIGIDALGRAAAGIEAER